jgi:hypothetical protein
MGLELSEAMYAGLSKIDTPRLIEASKNAEAFNELFPDAVKTFQSTATDTNGLKDQFVSAINAKVAERDDKDIEKKKKQEIYSDLAAGISAVLQTRSDLGVGIPDAVFVTGNQWPDEVKDFKITAYGMKDYNSSDVILRYGTTYYGISLKKKAFESAPSPTLINTAFGSLFQGTEFTSLRIRIGQAKKKFFAKVIYDACTDDTPNSPFYVPEANDGRGGTILECNQTYQTTATKTLKSEKFSIRGMGLQPDGTLDIRDAEKILDIKVDIWRKDDKGNWKIKKGVKLLQVKDPTHLTRISAEFPKEFQTRFRNYINKSLYARNGKISDLWQTFTNIMNFDKPVAGGKSIKQSLVDGLFSRILKIDLYDRLAKIKRNDFKFYLVTGAGRALKPRGSDVFVPKVEQGNTKGLSSILANLAELCPDDCQKSIEYQSASETAANVSLTLFVTPKGSRNKVPILDIGLRYSGNFNADPQFRGTMTKEFINYGKKKST